METIAKQKSCNEYSCILCDYTTSRKSSFSKHVLSLKHKKVATGLPKVANRCNQTLFTCDYCEKQFNHRSGLWKHKKHCGIDAISHSIHCANQITAELVMELIKDNKDMKQIILEQNNTIHNLVKNGLTTINTNTNCINNNKTFNLQVFLNETCKDAMNITDFVESIKLQLSDLEKVGEIGYIEGISDIITSNLKALDVKLRPVHCTDKKRETIYIKDDNQWTKEDDQKSKLRKAIKHIANKNIRLLPHYREKHPDYGNAESAISDKYCKMVIEAMGGHGNNETEKEDKIIRNISKNILVQK